MTELYNTGRLHSAIGYVTPRDKLLGKDKEIFDERDRKLAAARDRRAQLRQTQRLRQCQRVVTPRPAIDFAAAKSAIPMTAVLHMLGFQANSTRGAQHRGPCPLHGSTAATSRCFSAHLHQHMFHCFKCGRSGNALDLWAQATKQTPYDAAIDLCRRLNLPLPLSNSPRNREEEPVANSPESSTLPSPETPAPSQQLTRLGDSSSSH